MDEVVLKWVTVLTGVLSGLAGLGGVALWYLGLFLFRDALKGEYVFVMTPIRETE